MVTKNLDLEWRPINGYEGLYEVSERGDVYSCRSNRLLALSEHTKGYWKVTLYKDGEGKSCYVHRLVCIAFNGEPTEERNFVNHLDEDRKNNYYKNLEWSSCKENLRYSWDRHEEEWNKARYATRKRCEVIAVDPKTGEAVGQWDSMTAAAKDLGVAVGQVSKAAKNPERFKAKGLIIYKKEMAPLVINS